MYYIIDEWMRMTMIAIALGISEEKKKLKLSSKQAELYGLTSCLKRMC